MISDKKNNNKINNNNNEYKNRKIKLQKIKKNGFIFPNDFIPNINIKKIYKKFSKYTNQQLNNINKKIYIAGRIMQQRIMGKASFITLKNMDQEIQIYITQNKISIKSYNEIFKTLDIGDIISVIGTLFKTKTQQLSIYCTKINLLSKSLKPLPEKFHGLSNKEIKYRKRYLDLISNKKTMKRFIKRSKILMIIRNFMCKKHFLEVETPMMQNIPGGANAKPFITHHNTLNVDMYLRVSPELYLKRLIIGGFNKIYEINRNFRNEGISSKHNPEFTMMELYATYSTYEDLMKLIIDLLKYISNKIHKSYKIQYQKHQIDFNQPFQKFTIKQAILHYNSDIMISDLNNIHKIKNIAKLKKILIKNNWEQEKIITKIFEHTTEHQLIQPTFITEYPIQVSPLARRNNNNKNIADRFEFFMGGIEIGNGFSELNDSEDQKKRFLKKKIFHTSKNYKMFYDEEYVQAMEYGMPPTAGLGIGIDRLIMILTNTKNIRDIILFPTLKPYLK